MLQKTMSILVIALLIMSVVPTVFAEDDTTGDQVTEAYDDLSAQYDDATDGAPSVTGAPPTPRPVQAGPGARIEQRQKVRSNVQERTQQARENLQARRDAVKQNVADARQRLRDRAETARERLKQTKENIQERIQNAREKYRAAKERYQNAKARFQETKDKIAHARERYQDCQGDDSAECQRVRANIRANGKPFLLHSADMVLEALVRLQARVEGAEGMDADRQAELLTKIETQISEVEDAKATIESLDNESTPEQIREAAKTIRQAWLHARHILKIGVGGIVNAKLGILIEKADLLSIRLHHAAAKLAEQGEDTTHLEELLTQYDAALDEAATKWSEVKELWRSASNPGEIDEAAQAAHEAAKTSLKEARNLLRDIVEEIKSLHGNLDVVPPEADAYASLNAGDGADTSGNDATTETNDDSASDDTTTETNETDDESADNSTETDSASDDATTETNDDSASDDTTTETEETDDESADNSTETDDSAENDTDDATSDSSGDSDEGGDDGADFDVEVNASANLSL